MLFIATRRHLRVAEVPVKWAHDERTRINPLSDGMQMVKEALLVRWYWLRGLYRNPAAHPAAVPPAEPVERP